MVVYGFAAAAGLVLLLALSRVHVHKWQIEGVLVMGDAVEICRKCGSRRVWIAREGKEVRMEQMTREEWEIGAEVQTKLIRARDAEHAKAARRAAGEQGRG